MKSKKAAAVVSAAGIAMAVLILDAKTAFASAQAGVELCLRTVVPALFPFLVLSVLLTGNLGELKIPFLEPLGKLCGIPRGTETILLTGLLGGYPVGAQCVAQAHKSGQITTADARRMLGFCSNAGPAFLFGMLSPLFVEKTCLWWLWGIHILSALIVGALLPGRQSISVPVKKSEPSSPTAALNTALRAMAGICGWVIVFRIVIGFCDRWFLWLLPDAVRVTLMGILELTNGCVALGELPAEGLRFLLCALFLGFGGVCVGMQTVSVTGNLGTGMYFPGKLLQGSMSLLMAAMVQPLLFSKDQRAQVTGLPLLCAAGFMAAVLFFLKIRKNNSSNLSLQGV